MGLKAAAPGEAERIRRDARFSALEVARLVGVSHVTIRRWENGERRPTGEAAIRWADLLDALNGERRASA